MANPKFEIGELVYCQASGDKFDIWNGAMDAFGEIKRHYFQDGHWWYDLNISGGRTLRWRREDRIVNRAEYELVKNTKGI